MTIFTTFTVEIETDVEPDVQAMQRNINRAVNHFLREGEITAHDDEAVIANGITVDFLKQDSA